MKIGILTQPLHTNYGGLLQAFALQKFLRAELGHEAFTVDYVRPPCRWLFPYRFAHKCIAKFLFGRDISLFSVPAGDAHTARFVRENIRTTRRIFAPAKTRDFAEYGFEAFIVGSDQVWRADFSQNQPSFFLDFLGKDKSTRRVAYAASFGKDEWEFSPRKTKKFASLAKKFDAVSVREESAVALCKKYLGVPAEHLLDPTLLLDKDVYEAIIRSDEGRGFLEKRGAQRRVFAYILDEAPEKTAVLEYVAGTLNATAEKIMPSREERRSPHWVFPPVSAWLRGFRDAEFVVTDSFHGCVFSIIFNKPFLAIGNAKRGMARFCSLLKMFRLEERLFLLQEGQGCAGVPAETKEKIVRILALSPDWDFVNARRDAERKRSRAFLENALQ